MAGGSADAGRPCGSSRAPAGIDDDALLREIAAELGADVAAQVRPGATWPPAPASASPRSPPPAPYGVLVVPSRVELSTADVYREADRQGLPRDAAGAPAKLREVSTAAAATCPTSWSSTTSSPRRGRCAPRSTPPSRGARRGRRTTRWCADRAPPCSASSPTCRVRGARPRGLSTATRARSPSRPWGATREARLARLRGRRWSPTSSGAGAASSRRCWPAAPWSPRPRFVYGLGSSTSRTSSSCSSTSARRSASGPTCSSARWRSSRPARSSGSSLPGETAMLLGGLVAGQGKIDISC